MQLRRPARRARKALRGFPLVVAVSGAILAASGSASFASSPPSASSSSLPHAGHRTTVVRAPRTRAVTLRPAAGSRAHLAWPATHAAFSWTGQGAELHYRTWTASGTSSPWVLVPESHDMREPGMHYSAMLSVTRPESIEWRDEGPGNGAGSVEVHVLNTVDGLGRRAAPAGPARGGVGTPDIVTRAEWGADESVKKTAGDCDRKFWPAQQLFVHHTAGINNDPHPKATMRAIYWYHTVTRGWCDIGYNFVIGPGGRLFEGRWARRYAPWEAHTGETVDGRAVAGAHVADFNSGSVGVSLMGNYSTTTLGEDARRTLVRVLAWEADRRNFAPRAVHTYRNPDTGLTRRLHRISGHRDAGQTACPGGTVYARMPDLRRRVAAAIGGGRRTSILSLEAPPRSVSGDEVFVRGRLTTGSGRGLAGRKVTVYRRATGARWTGGKEITTGKGGSLALRLAPTRNGVVRAVFSGGSRTWGAQSHTRRLKVAPRMTLALTGGRMGQDGVRHYPAGTTEIPVGGEVRPPHVHRRVVVSVYRVGPDGGAGRVRRSVARLNSESLYSAIVAVGRPGEYRAVARLAAHKDHAEGTSPVRTFVVEGA